VRDVRALPEDALLERTAARVATLLAHGTTTVEIKSGYGLELATELKQLRVARRVAERVPVTVVPTFLGAHEVPPEYRGRRDSTCLVCAEMIRRWPAPASPARATYYEPGVFTPRKPRHPEARRARAGSPAAPTAWRLG
jgi:imidazolonepropionase